MTGLEWFIYTMSSILLLFQTDKGATKVEQDEPKTVTKFTDRYIHSYLTV